MYSPSVGRLRTQPCRARSHGSACTPAASSAVKINPLSVTVIWATMAIIWKPLTAACHTLRACCALPRCEGPTEGGQRAHWTRTSEVAVRFARVEVLPGSRPGGPDRVVRSDRGAALGTAGTAVVRLR